MTVDLTSKLNSSGSASTVSVATPRAATVTEPLAPALTVSMPWMTAKVAVAATGPAVPAGSTQTSGSSMATHDSVSGDSVQAESP